MRNAFALNILIFALGVLATVIFNSSRADAAAKETEKAAGTFTTRVALKSAIEIEPSKTDITLSDLVVAKGLSRTALERFNAVRLSDAPKSGETRTFSESVLEEAIAPELALIESETGEHFELKLPSRVTVSKKKFRLGKDEIQAELSSQFKALCAECEFQISNVSVPLIGTQVSNDVQWIIRPRPELPKGNFSIPIEITAGSQPTRTYWVSGVVSIRRPVQVAAREIAMGERIQAGDLITKMSDVTYSNDTPVTATELSAGVASRQIGAGQVVYRSSIRKELAVKQGDVVQVTTGSADWQITLSGVAQSSGYIGDAVRVKIPSTQKLVSGLLKDKGVVEVQ